MADTSITREERYLEYLTGDRKGNVPKPVTRRERYLYELCLKGMGGEISPEEIKNAVNEYLEKNPVKPGATTEQVQQIEQNKTDIASLKTETGSLKEDISTKITKFYASNQGETHLADSDNGKIMDMMLYGKSEQKQYSGKNLLNATLQTTTKNGVTCTANGDGTYILNGKLSSNTTFALFSGSLSIDNKSKIILMKNDTFADLGIVASYCAFKISSSWDDAINYPAIKEIPSGKIVQTINLVLRLSNSGAPVTLTNVLIKPMIVDASLYPDATYDDFEPYTGGIPSPNPDYPQEIKSVVNPTVKVCGKNLLKPTLQTTTQNGVTCTNNGDGTYTLNGTASVNTLFLIVQEGTNISNGTYKVTGCPSGGSSEKYYIRCGSESVAAWNDNGDGCTAIISNGRMVYRIVVVAGVTVNNLLFKPMLTTDLTATYDDFEPYHGQTVTIPYTLNAIPVNSGGNVTIGGQQYIADYVDVERGKLVRMVDSSKLDNTQSIVNKTEWLLAEPQETDLTKEEIAAFKALATYYPTTNISVNSEQLDGYTVFNYPISMENGWNYVKKQLNDNRDYIYDMDTQSAEAYVNSEYAVALTELEV